jgi:hypothetical protein
MWEIVAAVVVVHSASVQDRAGAKLVLSWLREGG